MTRINNLAQRHWWFTFFCIVFLGGIFGGMFMTDWPLFLLLGFCCGVCAFFLTNKHLLALCIFCVGIGFGARPISLPDVSMHPENTVLSFSGYIDGFPDIRKKNVRAPFVVESINESSVEPFRVLVLLPADTPELLYGQPLLINGKIQRPRSFSGFNYGAYLARHGIVKLLSVSSVNDIVKQNEPHRGSSLVFYAHAIRSMLSKNLSKHLPSPHDQILMGILLGVKNELPENTLLSFKNSGLQHILVVSGFNVTVLLFFILQVFKPLGRPISVSLALCALLFYAAMTGFDMPVVRASLMGAIVAFSLVFGRFNQGIIGLLLSLVFLGMFRPHLIQHDVSLHLSTGATFGILVLLPQIEKMLSWIPDFWSLRTLLITGLCAHIAVTPVIGWHFEETQLIGLLSNLFVEPLIPLAMAFGALIALFGFLPQWALWIISIPGFILTELLLWVSVSFDSFPAIAISKTFSGMLGILLFGYIIYLILRFERSYESSL